MTLLTPQEEAALACVSSLTQWFTGDETDTALAAMTTHDPGEVVNFLFGTLVATITIAAEVAEITPLEYVQALALDVGHECYFD